MKFLLDSFEYQAYAPNAGDGNDPSAADVNSERCIYIEQAQMGSTSFGGDDLVTMTGRRRQMKSGSIAAHVAAWVLLAACS
jgi:hypothetical protein